MALGDHVIFDTIRQKFRPAERDSKELMRRHLIRSGCRTWRKRVRTFASRRAHCK
ncbi:MAG: DUF2805 domain-containing protein [Pseudomonadota bacterium]